MSKRAATILCALSFLAGIGFWAIVQPVGTATVRFSRLEDQSEAARLRDRAHIRSVVIREKAAGTSLARVLETLDARGGHPEIAAWVREFWGEPVR